MNYISTTDLRTKSSELIASLQQGKSITLIHRSQIVGQIVPATDTPVKTIDAKKLQEKIDRLDLPRLTYKEIDKRYRAAMMKKHGKGIR
jgi:antitoxin (DNA-binding transcriptional repressor) of toxin-antitoxin stability system